MDDDDAVSRRWFWQQSTKMTLSASISILTHPKQRLEAGQGLTKTFTKPYWERVHVLYGVRSWMVYIESPGMVTCRRSCAHEDKDVSEEHLGVEVVISPESALSIARLAHC